MPAIWSGNNVINGALTWVGAVARAMEQRHRHDSLQQHRHGDWRSGNNDLNAAVVTNYGTVTWASGTIRGGSGTTIYNYGLWDAQSDQNFNQSAYGGAAVVFNNYGTFRKSGGASEFARPRPICRAEWCSTNSPG